MKNLKNRVISFLLIGVVLILSYFYSHVDESTCIYNVDADMSTYISTGTLSEGEELSQTFVAQNESIDEIKVKVDLQGDIRNVILQYTLLDEKFNEVYHGEIAASELKNQEFNVLKMNHMEHTKGKTYTLVFKEQNSDVQNGVSFWLTPGRQNGKELIIKGNSTDAELVAESIGNHFDIETYLVLLGMITFIVVFMKVLYKMFK